MFLFHWRHVLKIRVMRARRQKNADAHTFTWSHADTMPAGEITNHTYPLEDTR